jgi:pimeloyl-ACP methyl ester carboxylesterase
MHKSHGSGHARLLAAALLSLMVLTACAPGFRYTSTPALQFSEFDYGFPVNYALSNPRVAYVDQGSGEQVLLLIHGLAGNAGFWRYNIPELARHHRVIAVDLPGYGRSQKDVSYPYDMVFYAETLNRLLDELDVRQVVPVGHSMGGQIAMTLALRHPERVSRLVLAAPAGVEAFRPGEGEWLRNALSIQGIRDVPEDGIRRNLTMNFYTWNDRWEWLVEERARMARGAEMPFFAHAVVSSVGGMLDQPTTARLPEIRQPAMIIYGRYDGLIPNPYLHPGRTADVFRAGADAIPNATLVELDRTGHMLMIESAAEFNAAVLDYLRSDR